MKPPPFDQPSLAEVILLRAFLEAGDTFISGTTLAHRLGLSRVAVWQHLARLREQGFDFEAAHARGYRLTTRPPTLNAALLAATLPPARDADFSLSVLDEIDSTNDEAMRQLTAGRPTPFALLARHQTEGRGRLGRRWLSEPNGNLYLTLAFRPRLPPARMPTFTLWAGANLCELIATFTRTTPTVKWPNDLLFHGRKCGGILTEARIDADHIRDLVIGIGLNLAAPAAGWPAELRSVATSLAEQSRAPLDPNRLTAALLGRMLATYERFVAGDHQAALADLWHRYDALRDREVSLLDGEERITGIARGIDDTGALLVRTAAGRTRRFQAGEVTFARPPVPVSKS